MRMRSHLHAELIQAISSVLEHSPHPVHFYKVKAHSGIIGNEGADAYARTAALTDTTDITLPDARDPLHNFYWLSLKTSHELNGETHHPHTALTHYLIEVPEDTSRTIPDWVFPNGTSSSAQHHNRPDAIFVRSIPGRTAHIDPTRILPQETWRALSI
eukprot:1149050-Pelagomonas_calceolata.AAC.1